MTGPLGDFRRIARSDRVRLLALGLTAASALVLFGVADRCQAHSLAPLRGSVFIGQAASGVGNATSCSDAAPATAFNNRDNWGAAKAIHPGVVVHFCGAISTQLVAQGNGADGAPVTLRFEPHASLSEPACPAYGGCLNLNGRSYIVVDGGTDGVIQNTDDGTDRAYQSSTVAISAQPCDNCTIEHLKIQNMYVHSGIGSEVSNSEENCITFSGSNWQIRHNTFHDASWCIRERAQPGDTNVHVSDNEIYNVDHGFTVEGGYPSIGDIWFNNNHVHDMAIWDTANNAYHHDGIHCYTVQNGVPRHIANFFIYNNRFDGNIGNNATSWIFLEGAPRGDAYDTPCNDASSNIWIFNNVLTSTPGVAANGLLSVSNGKVFVAHNLIDGPDPQNPQSACFGVLAGGTYINNAVGGCNQLVGGSSDAAVLDYNAYAHCAGSYNCFAIGASTNWTGSFSAYRSRFPSLDTHSVSDYSSATGANVAGVATNLTSMCTGNLIPLCFDINGAMRPRRMPPDAGPTQAETAAVTASAVGRVKLGAPRSAVEGFYGTARLSRGRRSVTNLRVSGEASATYHIHKGILAVSYQDERVVAVATTSPYYTTPAGFGVGATADPDALLRSGWQRCRGGYLTKARRTSTAVRLAGNRITAIAVARSLNLLCTATG